MGPTVPPRFTFTTIPDGYSVTDSELGHIGTIHREKRPGATWWHPRTTTGEPLRPIDSRDAASWALKFRIQPARSPEPPPDPILAAIATHIREDRRDLAAAVLASALAEDIAQMRSRRRSHPAALWLHLDRYATWVAEYAGTDAPAAALPARLAHLQAL